MPATEPVQKLGTVTSDDVVACVLYYYEERTRGTGLPSDPQLLHPAFSDIQRDFPDLSLDYRFVRDPVVLRSERLHRALWRLQMSGLITKTNPRFAVIHLSDAGKNATEKFVIPKMTPEELSACQEAAAELQQKLARSRPRSAKRVAASVQR